MAYDGLGRRIQVNNGTANDLYYSSDWQVLEEQVIGEATANSVWSPVYVDAMVLPDSGTGALNQRVWVQQDANWNVTALVNGSESVVERDAYDPNGNRDSGERLVGATALTPGFTGTRVAGWTP